jgi:hypothetical protein
MTMEKRKGALLVAIIASASLGGADAQILQAFLNLIRGGGGGTGGGGEGGGIINTLLGPLLDTIAQTTCDAVTSQLVAGAQTADCVCNGFYTVNKGVGASIACTVESDAFCVSGLFCGKGQVEATSYLRSGIENAKTCFVFESPTFPIDIPGLDDLLQLPRLCITGEGLPGTLLQFASCEVTLGDTPCKGQDGNPGCTVCEGGQDFKFDCRDVNVGPNFGGIVPVSIQGPKIDECIGISLLTGVDNPASSLELFADSGN